MAPPFQSVKGCGIRMDCMSLPGGGDLGEAPTASLGQAWWLPKFIGSLADPRGVFPLNLILKSFRENSDAIQMGSESSKPFGMEALQERGFLY